MWETEKDLWLSSTLDVTLCDVKQGGARHNLSNQA